MKVRETILEHNWTVQREARLELMEKENGKLVYRVQVRDEGRPQPFVTRWFNDLTPAADFIEGMEAQDVSSEDSAKPIQR